MRESVIYQSIQAEAKEEERQEIAMNLLKEGISLQVIARVTGLEVKQIQQLQTQVPQSSEE